MLASVVIPAYNSRKLLAGCLTSVNHQIVPAPHSFEVVVVDDGSTDGTDALVRGLDVRYPLRYLYKPRTEHSCRSAARNMGIQRADGELIIMVDGDQILTPRFVSEHIRAHDGAPDHVVIGYRNYLAPGDVDLDALRNGFSLDALPAVEDVDEREKAMAVLSENLNGLTTRWHLLYGCNVSVRRSHLIAVGGFDEGIRRWSFEDNELGYRLHRRGLTFVFQRYAVLYHQFHQQSKREQYADWLANVAYFAGKHPQWPVRLQEAMDGYYRADGQEFDWVESYLRLEYAARAVTGRLPVEHSYDLLHIDETNRDSALAEASRRAEHGNLLIVDDTDDRDIPLRVQEIVSRWDLLYFKQPDPAALDRILRRHGVRQAALTDSSA